MMGASFSLPNCAHCGHDLLSYVESYQVYVEYRCDRCGGRTCHGRVHPIDPPTAREMLEPVQ